MKKIVVKLDVHDDKDKQKALKAVSSLVGIDSIAVDVNTQKMIVIGTVDPVNVVSKLRKYWSATQIDSVGPAKEPEKKEEKKEEGKKEEGKKEEPKKEEEAKKEEAKKEEPKKEGEKKKDQAELMVSDLVNAYRPYNPYMSTQYFVRSIEENPNSCVIC